MQRMSFWIRLLPLFLLALCFSDTAAAQITVNPTSLTFNVPGTGSQTLNLTITATGATTITAVFSVPWLTTTNPVFNVTSNAPTQLPITANAGTLANGQYTGQVILGGFGPSTLSVPVTMNVGSGTTGTLTSQPNQLTFSGQVGGTITSQTVVIGNPSAVAFTASASSTGNWLSISPTSGTTGSPSGTLTASINITGLTANTYNGTINVSSTAGTLAIPVTLTLTGAPTLSVTPTGPLSFFYQLGTAAPAQQTLSLKTNGNPVAFSISTSTSNFGSWLVVSPLNGATGIDGTATATVNVAPAGLTAGTYTGTITINAPGTTQVTTTVQVSLLVSANPLLQVSPSSLSFTAPQGGQAPAAQTLQLSSSGTALNYTVSSAVINSPANWLSASSAQSTTPGTVSVSVNQSGLPAGTYQGTVTLTSAGAGNSPITIPVSLTVNNNVQFTVTPPSLIFNFQTGQFPPSGQIVQVGSTGQPLPLSIAAATASCGSSWLSAQLNSSQTPAQIIVNANTSGLQPGTCQGSVTISSSTQGVSNVVVDVKLNVSNSPLLNVSPTFLSLSVPFGSNPTQASNISITATDNSAINFGVTASTSNGGNWLGLFATGASTPFSLSVLIASANLQPGTYNGTITISPGNSSPPVTIPVTLVVQSNATATASPNSLTFSQPAGAAAPPAQAVQLTSSQGTLNYSAVVTTQQSSGWLLVSNSGGTTPGQSVNGAIPGSLSVSVNGANLSPGTYNGQVTLTIPGASNTPLTIPVTLTVTQPQSLVVTPGTLTFTYQQGAATLPPSQNLLVSVSTGPAVAFTASASAQNGLTWLTIAPASGQSGNNISVSVNPANLTPGSYSGTVSVSSPIASQPTTIPVTLTVTARPEPQIERVLNGFSLQPGPITPGEIITIKGALLGPATASGFVLNQAGGVDSTLAGVRVFFDTFPGTPMYVSQTQINVVVPYDVAGRIVSSLVVEYQGIRSQPLNIQVAPASPAVLTYTGDGLGQAWARNQDSTLNGPPGVLQGAQTFAAPRGSIVAFIATGGGQTNPPNTNGCVTPLTLPLRNNAQTVTASIGGLPAEVIFAGGLPGFICGAMQVNIKIPDNAPTGNNIIVTISIAGFTSPATVIMAIR